MRAGAMEDKSKNPHGVVLHPVQMVECKPGVRKASLTWVDTRNDSAEGPSILVGRGKRVRLFFGEHAKTEELVFSGVAPTPTHTHAHTHTHALTALIHPPTPGYCVRRYRLDGAHWAKKGETKLGSEARKVEASGAH